MKAIFIDKDGLKIRTLELQQTPPFLAIPEFGEGRAIVPGQKMKIAKFKIRTYRQIGYHDGALIYKEAPAKDVFAMLKKKQMEDK